MDQYVIAETANGKLRGLRLGRVYRFLGVRFAEAPMGENRFLPPKAVKSWVGVRDALVSPVQAWQTDAPQMEVGNVRTASVFDKSQKMMVGSSAMGVGPMTEDILQLNLWTRGLNDGRKRPVMVWSHGGGNFCGAPDALWHDGYNMADRQDVIVVNVGHRLSVFGYLYLAAYGTEKFAECANLGLHDMVAALQWIHDNIEAFGGDPESVTIFGQSAGADMVTALLATPSVSGLFHKAIIQSGGFRCGTREAGKRATDTLLDYFGITASTLDRLQTIPAPEFIRAMRDINQHRHDNFLMFPTIDDGSILPGGPFDGAEGTALNADVPLIIGYTKDDDRLRALFNPALYELKESELPKAFEASGFSHEQAERLVEVYRPLAGCERPSAPDIYCAWLTDELKLRQSEDWYQVRKKFGCAPMYAYVFGFEGPYDELRAIHGVDVPFFFDAAQYAPGIWTADNHATAMELSARCGASWAAFARTGNPNHARIPTWKPYEEPTRYSMYFDTECHLIGDYHGEGRKAIYQISRTMY